MINHLRFIQVQITPPILEAEIIFILHSHRRLIRKLSQIAQIISMIDKLSDIELDIEANTDYQIIILFFKP